MGLITLYRRCSSNEKQKLHLKVDGLEFSPVLKEAEFCFYILFSGEDFQQEDLKKLKFLLTPPFYSGTLTEKSNLIGFPGINLIEVGPRLTFTTPFSTNATSACHAAGLKQILRIERSTRCMIHLEDKNRINQVVNALHDRMLECEYHSPKVLSDFQPSQRKHDCYEIDIMGSGIEALKKVNEELALCFDSEDLNYYFNLFAKMAKRNPTTVELFDLAQSNSEHSRHWFFRGDLMVDGEKRKTTLFQDVMNTQKHSNQNNVIKFCDNSSGIEGHQIEVLMPVDPTRPSPFDAITLRRHIIYTAETHNFPTAVCPFPGAATGTGGRIRDVEAAGRGSHVLAGISAYCVGNLNIPDYDLPWERKDFTYPSNFAKPLDVLIEASNGASDYGNKFGEPVIAGFARTFGIFNDESNERYEYVKPIMFSGGIGTIDDSQLRKLPPEKGDLVCKIGGPVYRIGVGGGVASSVEVQGASHRDTDLDFGAVQRGDPEMEQKLNRAIRDCLELREKNPIRSIHDQGAGGNGNVLKELVEGAGAEIFADRFRLGDATVSIKELWGAEYQESNALIVKADQQEILQKICARERCPLDLVGQVTGNNRIVLHDFSDASDGPSSDPVDLDLDWVLGKIPSKMFHLSKIFRTSNPFRFNPNSNSPNSSPNPNSIKKFLALVLRLPSVASKRYLTNKVDRSVTGLIAQQQCVGPLHTPLANLAVTAHSYFDCVGSAVAIGEQPMKMLLAPKVGARMAVGESLTNLVSTPISDLRDVKCSGNWMWPAKQPGEGANLVDACDSMCEVMRSLGIAIDGGKDSLSMAARVGDVVVKAPGTLVISAYAPCVDITKTVTPDLKCPMGAGELLYVRFGSEIVQNRLGGTALAQCLGQLGGVPPDLDSAEQFSNAFAVTQSLIKEKRFSAIHDVSDGGLISCLLEMAFGGNCGLAVNFPIACDPVEFLFAEELGLVLECAEENFVDSLIAFYREKAIPCFLIGKSVAAFGPDAKIKVAVNHVTCVEGPMVDLRAIWEETSYRLERLQCNPDCALQEYQMLQLIAKTPYRIAFEWRHLTEQNGWTNGVQKTSTDRPKVAVIREEGTNGDRELAAAFHMVGFEVWDVCMQDLLSKSISLDGFDGLAFAGGFSYADVLGSAKGWASGILFDANLKKQFDDFYKREDTFSLGICNGCQLMAQLGWIGGSCSGDKEGAGLEGEIALVENDSGRFESRFSWVKISGGPSVMLQGMRDAILGVWISHGEGKFTCRSDSVFDDLMAQGLIPIQYVDSEGNPTICYPFNPNGSKSGAAAVCSADGRHLAVMPHPERTVLSWQWPYWPPGWPIDGERRSPWIKMFENAFQWCLAKKRLNK